MKSDAMTTAEFYGLAAADTWYKVPFWWYASGFLFLIALMVAIVFFTKRKGWIGFATRRKWTSRIVLFLLSIILAALTLYVPAIGYQMIPGKIAMESPQLTATAIKVGIYGLYLQHEVAGKLPPESSSLVECVQAVSMTEAQKYQNTCGDNQACFENIPPTTRPALIEAIKKAQSPEADNLTKSLLKACLNVDTSKL